MAAGHPAATPHRFRPVQTRLYLQRRNGGAPTRVSRALLSISRSPAASAANATTTPNPSRSSHLHRRPLESGSADRTPRWQTTVARARTASHHRQRGNRGLLSPGPRGSRRCAAIACVAVVVELRRRSVRLGWRVSDDVVARVVSLLDQTWPATTEAAMELLARDLTDALGAAGWTLSVTTGTRQRSAPSVVSRVRSTELGAARPRAPGRRSPRAAPHCRRGPARLGSRRNTSAAPTRLPRDLSAAVHGVPISPVRVPVQIDHNLIAGPERSVCPLNSGGRADARMAGRCLVPERHTDRARPTDPTCSSRFADTTNERTRRQLGGRESGQWNVRYRSAWNGHRLQLLSDRAAGRLPSCRVC